MGNPAGTGYYYQQPQQYWQGQQQQNQYGYEDPQQERQQQQDQIGAEKQDEEPPLPPGWSEHFDPASGQPYYYNANDGTTTWDRPEVEVVEEANVEEAEAREEVPVEEETKEPEPVDEKEKEPSGDGSGSQYFSEDSRRQAMSGSQYEQEHGSPEQPSWGKNQTNGSQRHEYQQPQGWGMPHQQDPRPAWGVKPDDMRKEEQEDRGGMVDKPPMYQDHQHRGPDQPNLKKDRPDAMVKPMQQPEPEELKEPEERYQSYQEPPRDWQRQPPTQEEGRSAFSQTPEPAKSFPSASGAQNEFAHAQAQSQRQAQQSHPDQQRPPYQQQHPTEQQQRVMPQHQFGGPQAGQQTPPQHQQRPMQPGQPQRQLPPWQQQPPQRQQFPPQQGPPQQGVPPQGQYGQYNPQGYGQQHYGQYGAPPPGYGQQPQPESQVVAQSETASAVKEALGNAWKGVLGFGSRTKEVAEQAKETVAAKAAAAGQTIGVASQGM